MDKKQRLFISADIKCWVAIGKLVDRLTENNGVNITHVDVRNISEMLYVNIDIESTIDIANIASIILWFADSIKDDLVNIMIGEDN